MKLRNSFFITFSLALFLMACNCSRSTDPGKASMDIQKVLNHQTDEWNKGSIAGFMSGYEKSDSLQFITQRGRTVGWQNVFDRYSKSYPTKKDMGELQFRNLIVKSLSDSLAQVYGNWEVKKDSTFSGNFSLIMKNSPKGWFIIVDHTW